MNTLTSLGIEDRVALSMQKRRMYLDDAHEMMGRLEEARRTFEKQCLHHEKEIAEIRRTIDDVKSRDRHLNAPSLAGYRSLLIG
jgi:hypothetical protein